MRARFISNDQLFNLGMSNNTLYPYARHYIERLRATHTQKKTRLTGQDINMNQVIECCD